MGVRCVELPGIGTKYELETEKGDRVAIIFLPSRHFQLYVQQKGAATPSAAEISPSEARRLGSLLSGAIIEAEKEAVEIAFSALADLRIRVHTYLIRGNLAGKSIADLQVRTLTGATIVAVSRKGQNTVSPSPSFTFEDGDIAVVIGETEQLQEFERRILEA
ncbi:MAG: potassium transporter TrkA [Methanomicrobiales archaeon]|nr:potassium transporter TrkA [Methanomicrobiales archaeon]